jgi:cell division protein FtsW (lipid II flippase)
MDADVKRQLANVIAYLVTVVINGAAVALPLNGLTTAEISDRFPVLVTPANYVFSIWSVIYLLLAVFVVWQALPRNRTNPALRSIGYLPAVAGILNALWVVLWQYEIFELTVPVMLGLLVTLIAIYVRLRPVRRRSGADRWLVALPFSVYLGWITVATIANISQMLYRSGYRGDPLGEDLWTVIVLATGVVIAAVMLLREADWAYSLVIIWAYAGIAVKQDAAAAVVAALAGAIVVGMLIAYVLSRSRRSAPPDLGEGSPAA